MKQTLRRGTVRIFEAAGLTLILTALAWWAIVFAQVMNNTGFPMQSTLPCLLYTSDRCSLAMALCKDWHFLGIKRYSAELIWAGFAIASFAILLGTDRTTPEGKDQKP
jgi:hypothetical protein